MNDFIIDIQCSSDWIYERKDYGSMVTVSVCVDDTIIAKISFSVINGIKKESINQLVMKDLDEISSFLGIQFIRKDDVMCMGQSIYLTNSLRRV